MHFESSENGFHIQDRRCYETDVGVVVQGKDLKFPHVCPRCLSENPSEPVWISARDTHISTRPKLFGSLSTYSTLRYQVFICRQCSPQIRILHFIDKTLVVLSLLIACFIFWFQFSPLLNIFLYVFISLAAWGIFRIVFFASLKFFRIRREGIEILSYADNEFVHLRFSHPRYAQQFIEQNG